MEPNQTTNNNLINETLKIGGFKTKKETINIALREFIIRRKQLEIIELFGKFDPDPDYDYKQGRAQALKILVDTPIWSFAFRTKNTTFEKHVENLKDLIAEQRIIIIGAIRQEVLSGYSDLNKFEILKNKLKYFENTIVSDNDYIQAAKFFNICRKNGIQDSHTDFLICAVATRLNIEIYSTDKDFLSYQKYLPIKLYKTTVN